MVPGLQLQIGTMDHRHYQREVAGRFEDGAITAVASGLPLREAEIAPSGRFSTS